MLGLTTTVPQLTFFSSATPSTMESASASTQSTLPLSAAAPPTYNHTETNIHSLISHLSPTIPYTRDPTACHSTAHTAHSHSSAEQVPTAVFYPRTQSEVAALVTQCHARNVAVTSFCGGTSLGGALAATRGGVCVHFRDMAGIVELHEDDMDVVVQPGIGWVELNRYLEKKGLFFPVDPAPGAKIGGMIAMSCSGTNAYRYGTMKEWVISLTVVLADGSVVKTRNRPRKSSAGYDLTHLIIGSEGTLGLVTEAVLKVTALPKNLHVGMVAFETMQQGVDVAVQILRSGHLLEAIELADSESIRAINHSGLAGETFTELPTLFVKLAGAVQTIRDQVDFVKGLCGRHGARAFEVSEKRERIDVIWGARKCLGNAMVTMKKDPSDLFLNTDAAVPISKMARLVEESDRIVKAGGGGWYCASVGHVGDGNVHTAIVCPLEAKADVEKLIVQIQRLALELDGTITGEHGVGLKLRDLLAEEVGSAGVDAMRKIKMALDPKGILNPDKVVRLEAGY
ncbi:D-lactate dehydrogenase [Massariosphaeria phaeospora]|uniref:D-lactate dehydrogenase (cytochrome) n=1 Tax=Massariosphaeria phaeospora TaxID=100035 RepID=A0A7C8IA18_9PLEO|nr:D-lactate dehydrogenase [Massariosphaeria phaeospora]